MSRAEPDDLLTQIKAIIAKPGADRDETRRLWAQILTLLEKIEAQERIERGEDGFDGY